VVKKEIPRIFERRRAMLHRIGLPCPRLADFVDFYWLYEDPPPRPHTLERLLPTGTMGLIVNLVEDEARFYDEERPGHVTRMRGAVVSGAYAGTFVIDTAAQRAVAGVQFKPGGAFPFFGGPANEFRECHAGLDDVWGARAYELRERLLAAPTPEAKFAVFETMLLARLGPNERRHRAVAFALDEFRTSPHILTVGGVTEAVGLSQRRFIERFTEEVGLPPKLYCRIQRFQAVLKNIHAGHAPVWADIALGGGYYDQAHFIRDFKTFSGFTPTEYLARANAHLNHVPLV
jgi:AraC-like DNA-binding protein